MKESTEELIEVGKPDAVVDIDRLSPAPFAPEIEKSKVEELTESIKEHGLLFPIQVVEICGSYEIIAGYDRWCASKEAGLKEVPIIITEYPDEVIEEIMKQRGVRLINKDLPDNPTDEEIENSIDPADAYVKIEKLIPPPEAIPVDEEYIKDFGKYVKENGVPYPVKVRHRSGLFEIVAGLDWWYGANEADLKEIPVCFETKSSRIISRHDESSK